jgi:hypothetical protein
MDESPASSGIADRNSQIPEHVWDTYKEICANIRDTDEISFKLLRIVPLSSGLGAGALVLLDKSGLLEAFAAGAVIPLSLLGAIVTIGLFRWELRNIQRCLWLISRAAIIESDILKKPNQQYNGMANAEHRTANAMSDIRLASLFEWPWGKTQSEKLVYVAAIVGWLVPFFIAVLKLVKPA